MKILLIQNGKERCFVEVPQGADGIWLSTHFPPDFQAFLLRLNNRFRPLHTRLSPGDTVELIGMEQQGGNLVYQCSLCLVYIKAVRDVLGNVRVDIKNSLNQGLYTEIFRKGQSAEERILPSDTELKAISSRMRELIAGDLPIRSLPLKREAAMQAFRKEENEDMVRFLEQKREVEEITFSVLDGFCTFFHSRTLPSTGYLKLFDVHRYRQGSLLRFPHPSAPDKMPPYVDQTKLYDAFAEQAEWDGLLEINFVSDLNAKIAAGEARELIQLSEALHEKKIAGIADMIRRRGKRIILIAGPSSSGKTTFARRLCVQLRVNGLKALYMGTDDYFVNRDKTPVDRHGEPDYESIDAIDISLFNQNMNALMRGETVDLPVFDFIRGRKVFGKRRITLPPGEPVVIEGIHGLNRKLTADIPDEEKFKIYISPLTQLNIDRHNRIPTTDARMIRRLVRDYRYRAHSAQETIASWPKVRAGEDRNIFPFNGEADVFFNSYHVYELAVLAKYARPLLAGIDKEERTYAEAQRMLALLSYFSTIEDEAPIVNNSIIREFIGGSIFVE